jgi:hypothetical protein
MQAIRAVYPELGINIGLMGGVNTRSNPADPNIIPDGIRRNSVPPNRLGSPPTDPDNPIRDRFGNRLLMPGSAEIMRVRMRLSGNSLIDIRALQRRYPGRGTPARNEVWHHMGDYDPVTGEGTIILMPRDTHELYRHLGGSGQARAVIWDDPDRRARYALPRRERRFRPY